MKIRTSRPLLFCALIRQDIYGSTVKAAEWNSSKCSDISAYNALIFFNQSENIVSNADHKIAGQYASTQLIFKDKAKNDLVTVKFDDTNGWQVEWAK